MDTFEVGAFDIENARAAAGGDDQLVVRDVFAIVQDHLLCLAVYFRGVNAQLQGDVFIGVEFFGSKIDPFDRLLAGKVLLRKGRTLIRNVGFITDDGDESFVFLLAQTRCRLSGGVAGAYDDHS